MISPSANTDFDYANPHSLIKSIVRVFYFCAIYWRWMEFSIRMKWFSILLSENGRMIEAVFPWAALSVRHFLAEAHDNINFKIRLMFHIYSVNWRLTSTSPLYGGFLFKCVSSVQDWATFVPTQLESEPLNLVEAECPQRLLRRWIICSLFVSKDAGQFLPPTLFLICPKAQLQTFERNDT